MLANLAVWSKHVDRSRSPDFPSHGCCEKYIPAPDSMTAEWAVSFVEMTGSMTGSWQASCHCGAWLVPLRDLIGPGGGNAVSVDGLVHDGGDAEHQSGAQGGANRDKNGANRPKPIAVEGDRCADPRTRERHREY